MSEQFPEPQADTEPTETATKKPDFTAALKVQRAIIDSELFWHGRIMNSDQIHESAGTPYEGPRDF